MGDFTLATPVTRASEALYSVNFVCIYRTPAKVDVQIVVQNSGGTEDISTRLCTVPDPAHVGATVSGFVGALINARSGETGSNPRRANFRVLGYLMDQGYLPAGTLNP